MSDEQKPEVASATGIAVFWFGIPLLILIALALVGH